MSGDREGEWRRRMEAPPLHAAGLLLALLTVSLWGAIQSPFREWPVTLSGSHARVLLYVQTMLLQVLWVAYVWIGVRRAGTSLRALADDSRWTGRSWLRHAGIGIAAWIAWMAISAGLGAVLRPEPDQLRCIQAMLPAGPFERTLWVGFALTVGVCEEVVYRGYLLQQFRALTNNALVAVVVQAVTYGLAHLVLPAPVVASVVVLGTLLGALAVWQRSLVPGMILHVGVGLTAIIGTG